MPFTTLLNSAAELARLRHLLHQEPHVRGWATGSTGTKWRNRKRLLKKNI